MSKRNPVRKYRYGHIIRYDLVAKKNNTTGELGRMKQPVTWEEKVNDTVCEEYGEQEQESVQGQTERLDGAFPSWLSSTGCRLRVVLEPRLP